MIVLRVLNMKKKTFFFTFTLVLRRHPDPYGIRTQKESLFRIREKNRIRNNDMFNDFLRSL